MDTSTFNANPPVEWTLQWPFGEVTVQALGGMVAPLTFSMPGGKTVSPLQIAPWGAENDSSLPGVLRRLRGEWPCLPFGASRPPEGLPENWTSHDAPDNWDHGFTANHDWYLIEKTAVEITIGIEYPQDSSIDRLQRRIRPHQDEAAIDVELMIYVRKSIEVPLALHPTFMVPASGVEISAASSERIYTYPVQTELGISRLVPNTSATSLGAMPTVSGVAAFNKLPLPYATEELMQMEKCKPPFTLHYIEDKVDIHLDWDTDVLPDALIWISNAGRSHIPWSSRHFALGIEPMSGFFDLGRVVSPTKDHALAENKGVQLIPGKPLVVVYSIAASSSER